MKQAVQETSSSVPMVSAYQRNGNVMVTKTANLGMMRKIVNQVLFYIMLKNKMKQGINHNETRRK